MKMTFTQYDELVAKYEKFETAPLSKDYGLIKEDIELMENGGDRFVPFLIYLSTRPWYRLENREDRTFKNKDAMSCKEASEAIDELLYKMVELVDEEDDK